MRQARSSSPPVGRAQSNDRHRRMYETGRTQSCGFPAAFRWSRVVYSIPRAEGSEWDGAYSTKLFCILKSVWLRLSSGPRRWSGRSVWVFLARGRFAAKTPAYEPWISLDFLGFSRPDRDFSMGYADFSGKNFSPSFSAGTEAPEREPHGLGMRKRRIVHGSSLPRFLIFCKSLSSEQFPFGRLDSTATRTRSQMNAAGSGTLRP
jgi:hypothetical protein